LAAERKTIIVYAAKKPQTLPAAREMESMLRARNVKPIIMSLTEFDSKGEAPEEGVLVVLGGDGTLLRTVKNVTSNKLSVLGVNFGRSGFLMQAEPSEMPAAVEKATAHDPPVDEVMRLSVSLDGFFVGNILNEVYLSSKTPGRVIEYVLKQGGELIDDVADGVVIATPVGSTAYAMSAGGPAVDERLEAVIVAPVASLRNMRPLVLPASQPVEIEVKKGDAQIIIDGHTTHPLQGRKVWVEKSKNPVKFIRVNAEWPFARRVRKRLYGGA